MKAEKVLGIVACAVACASSSVFANTTSNWFGVVASDAAVTTNNATVVGTIERIEESKIYIDNDKDSAYTVSPSVATPALNDGLVTITSSAILTPSEVSDLDLVGAQAGFAVGVSNNGVATNFYGFASAATNGLPAWIQLSGTPSAPETPTQFKIVLDYRTSTVQFYQGNDLLSGDTNGVSTSSFAISNNFVNLSSVAAYGSGAITSIESQYEVAVVAYNGNKYGSVADAITAGGAANTINDVTSSGAISEDVTAANGLPVAVCKALGISTTEENTAAVEIVPTATDPDEHNVTLQLDPSVQVESGVAVKFAVKQGNSEVTGSPFASNAIKVPLAAGTYTIEPVGVAVAP